MGVEKICIEVGVRFRKDGGMIPVFLIWAGKRIAIDRVCDVRRSFADVPNVLPIRYRCTIMGKERNIFYEPSFERWFVEVTL